MNDHSQRETPDVKRMGAVTIARNGYIEELERQLAEARQERDNAREHFQAAMAECQRLEQERDEAREQLRDALNQYGYAKQELFDARKERDELREKYRMHHAEAEKLTEVIRAATVLIAAKGRHNTMLAYEGLRSALSSQNVQGHAAAERTPESNK